MKYLIKNIRENKFRGILILLSLVMSTFILFLNLGVRDDILYKYKDLHENAFKGYNVIVNRKDQRQQFFEEKDFNDVDHFVRDKLSSITTYGVIDDDDLLTVKLYGCNINDYLNAGLIQVLNTSIFDTLQNNQILISPQLSKSYGFIVGDKISIQTQLGIKEYIVGAIGERDGLFLNDTNENLIVMSDLEARNITGQENKVNAMLLKLEHNKNLTENIEVIKKNNPNYNVQPLLDQGELDMSIGMISQILIIILVLAVIINYYVISSNAKVILLSRIPIMGTFRSLGASKLKVNLILIIENLIYGVLGGIVGVGLGVCFRKGILGALAQGMFGIAGGQASSPIKYSYIIFALLFAVIIQLISVISTIYESGNHSIKGLIFSEFKSIQKVSNVITILGFMFLSLSFILYQLNNSYNIMLSSTALVVAMIGGLWILPFIAKYLSLLLSRINKLIFGAAPSLGSRNIADSKIINSNMKLVVISLTVVLMIFISTVSLESVFLNATDLFETDIQINGMGKSELEYLKLKEVDGVTGLDFLYYFIDDININDKKLNVALFGFDDEQYGITNVEGKISQLKNNEVMIDEFYALKHGFKIGDVIEIRSSNLKLDNHKFEIVGTIDSSLFTTSRNIIIISKTQFKDEINDIPNTMYVETSKDLELMKKTLYKELSGEDITIQTMKEVLNDQKVMVNSILSMVWLFLTLSILLSTIGLINNLVIGFIQRKREYAVLYSISMSRSQLIAMIFFEIMNSFLIGCVYSLVLSVWMSKLLQDILNSIGMFMQFNFPLLEIIGVVGVIFIVLMFTALIPMYKIHKMNVVEGIKYE